VASLIVKADIKSTETMAYICCYKIVKIMEPGLYIVIYLVVALIITVVFDIEPVGSVLWGLFPILFPILYIKSKLKK
jgi:hypothetical protein